MNSNEAAVAEGIERCHEQNISILKYNAENFLSCVIGLTFYAARAEYTLIREMPAGKGFADIVFLPKKNVTKPPILMELKWLDSPDTALSQIKSGNYSNPLLDLSKEVIVAGITYEKDGKDRKHHSCKIQKGSLDKLEK